MPFVFANVLQPLIDFFEAFLEFFHGLGLGWGLAIVALTVVIRAALLPLTLKQTKSMYRMAQFAPQLKEIQRKHKNDPQRAQRETMAFYRENKINPAASCLPLLAQLPVFLALFYMLQDDLRIDICPEISPEGQIPCGPGGDHGFLFIQDLTDKATGGVLVILILLYVGSQLASFLVSANPNMDKTQRYIFMALPIVFVAFIWNFPAGLLVYWITTNLWTILQGVIVRQRLGHLRPPPPEPGTGGGLGALFGLGKDEDEAPSAGRDRAGERREAGQPASVAAGSRAARPTGPPPASPRKKRKRSGRRR